MTAAHHTGRRAYAERAEAETVSNAPAVGRHGDAQRLLNALHRIAKHAGNDSCAMATALGRIAGLTVRTETAMELKAAANAAEGI